VGLGPPHLPCTVAPEANPAIRAVNFVTLQVHRRKSFERYHSILPQQHSTARRPLRLRGLAMSYRFSRACITFGLVLIGTGICAQTPAPARVQVPMPDHCIVGESVFGCVNASAVAEITAFRGDSDDLKEKIAAGVASGDCRMFVPGDPVFVARVAADTGLAAVRLPGDTVSYWMPASWSRPTAECAAYATRRSVREKLGLAATTQTNPPEPDPAGAIARPAPPRRTAPTKCAIKPVMTDAEIAMCRNLNR